MTVFDLKKCPVCGSYNLIFKKNYEHEDIMLSTLTTEIYRIDDVAICEECDTIMFVENNRLQMQFSSTTVRDDSNLRAGLGHAEVSKN